MFEKDIGNLKYVDAVLSGRALAEEIDDYIDLWHEGDSSEEIYDFLGMSNQEYSLFVEQPYSLNFILHSREYKENVLDVMRDSDIYRIAARSLNEEDGKALIVWLKKRGYFE